MADLADMRAKLERMLDTAYGGRLTGAALGMLLGEIGTLRREIATIEQRAAATTTTSKRGGLLRSAI
jgi:hypothetical protein